MQDVWPTTKRVTVWLGSVGLPLASWFGPALEGLSKSMRPATRLSGRHPGRSLTPPRIALLGGFEVQIDNELLWLPRGAQRLVALLSLRNRATHRAYIAGTFWSGATEAHACANLRTLLWRLGGMRSGLIEGKGSYLWLVQGAIVDVRSLIAACTRVSDRSEQIDTGSCGSVTRSGEELLPGWYEDWVVVERERLRQMRLHALEVLCERLSAAGEFGSAIEAGLAAVASEPLRESAHRVLIEADLAQGNRAEAVRHFRMLQELLRDELGVEPPIEIEGLVTEAHRATTPRGGRAGQSGTDLRRASADVRAG